MKNKARGFSLIELAIVMLVSGLIYAAVFSIYSVKLRHDQMKDTFEKMRLIRGVLTEYVASLGAYPCPADPALAFGNPNYAIADCSLPQLPSGRDSNDNGDPTDDTVLEGAVPYNTINPYLTDHTLTVDDILDAWGNKFTYAISYNLIDPATYADSIGSIDVEDERGRSILGTPGSAHFVIISHGPNGRGAYTQAGQLVEGCGMITLPTPPPLTPSMLTELENCDEDDGDYLSALQNDSSWFPYDDIVQYQAGLSSYHWVYTDPYFPTDPSDPIVPRIMNTNIGNVGIGEKVPQVRLSVNGGLLATTKARANQICDEGGIDCMDVDFIAGNSQSKNTCSGGGTAIKSIEGNQVNCQPIFTSRSSGTCAPDTYVVGLRNDGSLVCEALPSP